VEEKTLTIPADERGQYGSDTGLREDADERQAWRPGRVETAWRGGGASKPDGDREGKSDTEGKSQRS
jgi:hypothetical protein